MLEILSKIKFIFDKSQIKKTFLLLFAVLIGVLLEMLSIGLIIPILTLMSEQGANRFIDVEKFASFFPFVSISDHKDMVFFSIYLLLIVYFLKTFFLTYLLWFQSKFVNNLHSDISFRIFKTYLFQDYIFHIKKNSSELIQNATKEIEYFVNAFFLSLIIFITEVLIIIGISIVLFIIEPLGFSVILILFGGSSFIFSKFIKKSLKKWGEQRNFHQTLAIQHIQQGLRNIKDVKILGKEIEFAEYFRFHMNKFTKLEANLLFLKHLPKHILELIGVAALVVAITIFIMMDYNLSNILITVGVFAAAALKILPSTNRIINTFIMMRYSYVSVNMTYRDLSLNYKKIETEKKENVKLKFKENIKLDKVSYKYPDNGKLILNNINLIIRNNSTVGIVGESGSGKTTFIDLIIGILKPTNGKILIDDENIYEKNRLWQNNIGYIPQFIYLTDDTIRRNIAFGIKDEEIDEVKIKSAILTSQMGRFIEDLTLKENTKVGELGVTLSGGQRQRIGIARALYNNPNLLVMDEATNALDEETEKEIMNSIYLMKGKKTILMSSHKKSILERCDKIFKFENGMITSLTNGKK